MTSPAAPNKKAPSFRLTLASNGWIIRTHTGELIVCREWSDLVFWMHQWVTQVEGK